MLPRASLEVSCDSPHPPEGDGYKYFNPLFSPSEPNDLKPHNISTQMIQFEAKLIFWWRILMNDK